MSGERPISLSKELIESNGLSLGLLFVEHKVKDEIEELGEKLFSKGASNIFFFENAAGDEQISAFNRVIEETRSMRIAYWQVTQKLSADAAKQKITEFERDPLATFSKYSRNPESQAFMYAVFTGMDNLLRKGYKITVAAERSSEERKSTLEAVSNRSLRKPLLGTTDKLNFWKAQAQTILETDKAVSQQITEILSQAEAKTKILILYGLLHKGMLGHFPAIIQGLISLKKFTFQDTDESFADMVVRIQQGTISDEEILAIIKKKP